LGAMTKEQALALAAARVRASRPKVDRAAIDADMRRMADPTGSFTENFAAGMGKAFADIGRGSAQMVGMGPSAEEMREIRRQDAPLMKTGGGVTGNVAGNIAVAAPLAMVPGANTVAGAGAIGSILAAVQPTESTGERLTNMGVGGVLGSTTQAVGRYPMESLELANKYLGAPFRAGKAVIEPFYEGGREQILARALRDSVGPNSQAVKQRLASSRELVPGSLPTAAEVGQSGGLAALQRSAAATNPEAYTTRAIQQNEARTKLLQDLSGAGGRRAVMEKIRDEGADEMYAAARRLGVDKGMAKAMNPQIQNLMERMPSSVLEKAKELARLNGETMDSAGSLNGLHWTKLAVDDMLSSGKQSGIGTQTTRALAQFKDDLLSVTDELSPAYGHARRSFAEMSRIPNQMATVGEIANKATNPLTGQVQPQAYARAFTDDSAVNATGFNRATLRNTLEPQQLSMLEALKGDLARSVQARDLGRGPGSDTVQKLAMSNIMDRAGIPSQLANFPGVSRLGNFVYSGADDQMRQMLAEALLNPKETARLMGRVPPYAPPLQTNPTIADKTAAFARALGFPLIPEAVNQ
jgi:hypothetical protein